MVDILDHLALGFGVALTLSNLLYCFTGALLGTLIGVLPGLGPAATIAILLPVTFSLDPIGALIMLSGIYYGSQYGGSTTAILVNLPGESASVVTAIDGYQLARQGRSGEALAIAALGSFFAGSVATLLIAAVAVPLSRIAVTFGAAEYFSLMVLGLIAAVVMAHGELLKAIAMILLGLAVGLVGVDIYSAQPRFMFGMSQLTDGINFVPMVMGVFGIAEILRNIETPVGQREVISSKITGLWPSTATLRRAFPAVLRGTAIGSLFGVLPGSGATLSSFSAYALEKKISRTPERFGTGMIEGVAGPESANNAGAQTSFIPMLTLGIPSNAVMALIIGGLMIHGITPGPLVIQSNPQLFWGLIASMWIGNLMLLVINLPLIGIWVQILKLPYRFLFPAILLFSCIGVYTLNNSVFDVATLLVFSVVGYLMLKLAFEPAPFVLGFILGPLMEENLRRAMLISRGDPMIFLNRPVSLGLLLTAAILLLIVVLPMVRRKRATIFTEEES